MNLLKLRCFALVAAAAAVTACNSQPVAGAGHDENVAETGDQLVFGFPKPLKWGKRDKLKVQLGPRPFYLIEDMDAPNLSDFYAMLGRIAAELSVLQGTASADSLERIRATLSTGTRPERAT